MKLFQGPKKKNFELAVCGVLAILLYLIFGMVDVIVLFSLGFIWNWVGSHDLAPFFENRRYRFSTLKTVYNLNQLALKPLANAPEFVRSLARVLPAGIFWGAVNTFLASNLPWWVVFCGSFSFEALHFATRTRPQPESNP